MAVLMGIVSVLSNGYAMVSLQSSLSNEVVGKGWVQMTQKGANDPSGAPWYHVGSCMCSFVRDSAGRGTGFGMENPRRIRYRA